MPVASRAIVNGQRVKLKAIQDLGDKQILVAFAAAHMAVSPEMNKFTQAYAAELNRVRGAAVRAGDESEDEDEEGSTPDATVSLSWLQSSGALKSLTNVLQQAMETAAKAAKAAADAAAADAQLAGMNAGVTLIRVANGKRVPVHLGKGVYTDKPLTKAQALALLAEAEALDPDNQTPEGMDETIDGLPAQTTKDTRNAAVTGLVAGLTGQALQQALMMGLQTALTDALSAERNGASSAFSQMVNMTITQNPSLLNGWVWTCGGGACIACLEMDGSIHTWDEDLSSHLNCQCLQVPYTAPLPDDFMTGDQWFNAQSDLVQYETLGPSKYLAWKNGDVQLMDFVDHSNGYISERSLKSLGLDYRDYLQQFPRLSEFEDYSAAEIQRAMDAAEADMRVVAYAPEMPAIPELPSLGGEPGKTMGYDLVDKGGAGAARLQELVGHDMTPDEIGRMVGAQEGNHLLIEPYHENAVFIRFWSGDYKAERALYRDSDGLLVMSNDNIKIENPALRGQGLGSKIFGEEVQNLSAMGVDRIETGAAGSAAELARNPASANGFITWARLGYQTNLEDLVDEGLDLEALQREFPGVETLQDLMLKPGGPEYWRANGVPFRGTFDLHDGSTSRWMLDQYLEAKGIEIEPLAEAAAREAETAATIEESPAIQQLRADREALQTQRDAIQAKQDVLSEKWRTLVLKQAELDPEEEPEAIARMEKQIARVEKQQGNNITRMQKLDAKIAKIDAKLPTAPTPEVAPAPEIPAPTPGGEGAKPAYTLPEIDREAEQAVISAAQDALSGDGVANHAEVMDLGTQMDTYLDDRIGPLADYAREAYSVLEPGAELTPEQEAWLKGDVSQHGGLTARQAEEQYQAAMRDETVRLVDEVRGVGGDLTLADGADEAVESALDQIQQLLPSDWIEASNSQGLLKLEGDAGEKMRGYYNATRGGGGIIALRTEGQTADDLATAIAHEAGHRLEDSTNGIWLLEKELYNARTAGEDFVDLDGVFLVPGRTKEDEWALQYMGKEPILVQRGQGLDASGQKLRSVYHYELLSVGLEWLLGNDVRGQYFLAKDPEFRQWLLGVLFGAKDHVV